MLINDPGVLAEVTDAFYTYEAAIAKYDADKMNELFWNSEFTLRYGPDGTLIGHAALSNFRKAKAGKGVRRELQNTVITTFGDDFAVANTESRRGGGIHRQSQSWVRMPEGWRIVAAHVSEQPGS